LTALLSKGYRALLQQKHAARPWGGTGELWAPVIAPLFTAKDDVVTVLDFGCGRGTFKPAFLALRPGAIVDEYDPGVKGKDVLPPGRYDLVVCTDVMEHVEEEYVPAALQTIHDLTARWVFFNIVLELAGSKLPDGRNTHITIQPDRWWIAQVLKNMPGFHWTLHARGEYEVAVKPKTTGRLVLSGRREEQWRSE
jgi:hypothetical protein